MSASIILEASTREIVTRFLEKLGDTPDQVAATLARGGHRGERHECYYCPVALYLAYSMPDLQFETNAAYVIVYGATPRESITVLMPEQVTDFIVGFDSGRQHHELLLD